MSYPGVFPNSPAGYDFGQGSYNSGQHPAFEHAGNLYTFVTQDSPQYAIGDPTQDYKLHCFQSTDAGQTWTELDAVNAPAKLGTGVIANYQYSVAVDGDTAVIFNPQLSGPSTVVQVNFIRFDLATGLWGSNTVCAPVVHTSGSTDIIATFTRLLVLSSGNYLVYFSGVPATVSATLYARLYYATFDGATFGTVVALPDQDPAGAFSYIGQDAVVDSSGIVTFVYQTLNGGLSNVYSVGLDTGGFAFGTPQTLPNALSYYDGSNEALSTFSNLLLYTPSGGSEMVAVCGEITTADFTTQTLCFYSAASALNPTWAQSTVTTGVDQSGGISGTSPNTLFPIPQTFSGGITPAISIAENNGLVAAVWNYAVPDTWAGKVIYSTSPSEALAWTTQTVLWHTGPITGSDFTDTSVVQIWAFPITDGIGVLASCINLEGNGGEVMQFDMISSPEPPETAQVACSITITSPVIPPTITCGSPPAGVYGVPYSHDFSLTTSSGTPPYTWAIISGLLPPGLTLDGATGIVSGTPTTAGFYPFTIQAMDSLMLTGSVDCSITTAIPGIGNLYTLEPTNLTDDDYGRIYPHYVTYFMPSPEVAASAGMASRKMVAYLKSNISGTGVMTITAYPDNLSNPWPLRCSRTLTQMPRFDLEWSGASCIGDRIAVKFESSPAAPPLTDNEFSLQGLSVWARGNARLPVRGRAT